MVRLVSLLLFGLCAGAQSDEAERAFAKAVQLHQAGDIDGAIPEYQAYLKVHPERVEARSNLGAALARLGRYEEAIEQYRQALALNPQNNAVRKNLALAHYKAQQISEAVRELEALRERQPGDENTIMLLADCNLRLGENKRVIELLTPLQAARPQDPALEYLLGTALIRDNQLPKGQLLVDRILRDGDSAEARLLLGTSQLMANDYPEALKNLARAVELKPDLPDGYSYYGMALLDTGDTTGAEAAFRKELARNANDFDSNLNLGALLKRDHDYDNAIVYLRRALQVRPRALDARYQIAALNLAAGRVEEARRDLEAIVKEAPAFVEAHVSLATAYYRLNRKTDGNREQAIVAQLNTEQQAQQPGGKLHQDLMQKMNEDAVPAHEKQK